MSLRATSLISFLCALGCGASMERYSGNAQLEPSPHPGQMIAMVLELSPWAWNARYQGLPRVALFEDGSLLIGGGLAGESTALQVSKLLPDELSRLDRKIRSCGQLSRGPRDFNLAPGVSDLPEVSISISEGDRLVTSTAYGLVPKGHRPPAYVVTSSDARPDSLSSSFSCLYKLLTGITVENHVPWHPDLLAVTATPYEHSPETPLRWPEGWPTMSTAPRKDWDNNMGTVTYFVDAKYETELAALLDRRLEKQAIEVEGKKWSIHYNPVAPGTQFWQSAQDLNAWSVPPNNSLQRTPGLAPMRR